MAATATYIESGLQSKEIANSSFPLGAGRVDVRLCSSVFRNLLFRSEFRGMVPFISDDLRNSCCESSQTARLTARDEAGGARAVPG